jgi:hypothetical protein
MNQRCFWVSGPAQNISEYSNKLIENGWKIVSLHITPDSTAVILAENSAAAPLNLTFNKK